MKPSSRSTDCRSTGDGNYEICNDFILDDWLRAKIHESEKELDNERGCVSHLIGMAGGACAITGVPDTTVRFWSKDGLCCCVFTSLMPCFTMRLQVPGEN